MEQIRCSPKTTSPVKRTEESNRGRQIDLWVVTEVFPSPPEYHNSIWDHQEGLYLITMGHGSFRRSRKIGPPHPIPPTPYAGAGCGRWGEVGGTRKQ